MWEYVGMARSKEGLQTALGKLKEIRKEFETNLFIPHLDGVNVELDKAIRLNDFITMGQLIAIDALHREESCGGHFRVEHQTEEGEAARDDKNCFYVSMLAVSKARRKTPSSMKKPLHYEAIEVKTRNYKSIRRFPHISITKDITAMARNISFTIKYWKQNGPKDARSTLNSAT